MTSGLTWSCVHRPSSTCTHELVHETVMHLFCCQVVKDNLKPVCKCHGQSGSCAIKTCWISLPDFRTIGTNLMSKYKRAKHVIPWRGGRSYATKYLKVINDQSQVIKPRPRELVYLHDSPSYMYCEADTSHGYPGTRGRRCSVHSHGQDHCDIMCCGRGYNTRQQNVTQSCNCKFHWCCVVKCDNCTERVTTHTCK